MGNISKEDLFREIGDIDEAYVEEAERAGRRRKTAPWMRTTAVAASLLLCVGICYGVLRVTGVSDGTANMAGGAMEDAAETYFMAQDGNGGNDCAGQENCAIEDEAVSEEKQQDIAENTPPGAFPEAGTTGNVELAASRNEQESETTDSISSSYEEIKNTASDAVQHLATESSAQKEDCEVLTWEAAQADAVYGQYVDVQIPEGYVYTGGTRSPAGLHVTWSKGMEEISISCGQADESVSDWLADVDNPQEYDMGLYTIPLSESVPQELAQKVSNATFRAQEVTLQIVEARSYQTEDQGDVSGWHTRLGILYGDNVLVNIRSKGPSPEEIYAMLNLEN